VSTINSISISDRASSLTKTQKRHIRSWVTALRSGRYKQTEGKLHDETGYCCLGVACDVYRKAAKRQSGKPPEWVPSHDNSRLDFLGATGTLPDEVADWFGLSDDPLLLVGDRFNYKASTLNDEKLFSLKRIATAIQRTYLGGRRSK
jgi:hypothetical protein